MTVQREGIDCHGNSWHSPEPVHVDTSGRRWERKRGLFTCIDGFTSGEAKSAFQLRRNVEAFVEHWGRDHCAFLTLTDSKGMHPREFAKKWHSFLTHEGQWIVAFTLIRGPQLKLGAAAGKVGTTPEPAKRPLAHHHLFVTPWARWGCVVSGGDASQNLILVRLGERPKLLKQIGPGH